MQRQRRPTLEALRRARVDAGLTISELAKRAGVSRDTISHAERGRHSLQGPTLSKIASALGRAPSELLAEEERLAPKGSGRSSPEPSLFSELEDERRRTFVQSCRRYAESRAKSYEIDLATLTQEGDVFAGPEGARILFVGAYEEYVELRPLVGRDLAFLFDEGLSEHEASRFSSMAVAALFPLAATVERLADRAAELAETQAQKAEVEQRRQRFTLIQGDIPA